MCMYREREREIIYTYIYIYTEGQLAETAPHFRHRLDGFLASYATGPRTASSAKPSWM